MNLTTFEQLENQPTKTLLLKVMKVENAAADHGKVVPWLNEVIASSFVNEDPLMGPDVTTDRVKTLLSTVFVRTEDGFIMHAPHAVFHYLTTQKHTHWVTVEEMDTDSNTYCVQAKGYAVEDMSFTSYTRNSFLKCTARFDPRAPEAAHGNDHKFVHAVRPSTPSAKRLKTKFPHLTATTSPRAWSTTTVRLVRLVRARH